MMLSGRKAEEPNEGSGGTSASKKPTVDERAEYLQVLGIPDAEIPALLEKCGFYCAAEELRAVANGWFEAQTRPADWPKRGFGIREGFWPDPRPTGPHRNRHCGPRRKALRPLPRVTQGMVGR